jgi:hypothetical protein
MKALGYAWRVLVNLFYVAIVLYVFEKLHGRHETTILVAVLGLIYVTIRSIAIGQAHGAAVLAKGLTVELMRIRELLRDETIEGRRLAFKDDVEVADRMINKAYIDGFFLAIVSLICLLMLFVELS